MPKLTDRKADYMCFSPLRRKTSELEGEEEFHEKTVKKLFIFFTVLKNAEKSTKN
jgi:hypothetical protein